MIDDALGLVGSVIDGKYRVEEAVARGGFGVVYRAVQVRLKRLVALKVLAWRDAKAPEAAEVVAAFQEEAELLARLDHPAVVRVLDVGAIDVAGREVPWMTLEWVEGRTLTAALQESPDAWRDPMRSLTLLRPVLEALAQAHALGIVHRDIKPGNIMLTTADGASLPGGGRPGVRLLDFGIAKVMGPGDARPSGGETATASGVSAFSMHYAAPEQISGARTGPWTDVHAVALLFSHLLTGERPYPGEDAISLAARALASDRPTPARRGVDVGPWEAVLGRALSLIPASRYQTAREFLDALEADLPLAPDDDRPQLTLAPESTSGPMVVPRPSRPRVEAPVAPASAPPPDAGAQETSPRRLGALAVVAALALVAFAWWALPSSSSTPPVHATTPTELGLSPSVHDAAPSRDAQTDASPAVDAPPDVVDASVDVAPDVPARATRREVPHTPPAGPVRTTVVPVAL